MRAGLIRREGGTQPALGGVAGITQCIGTKGCKIYRYVNGRVLHWDGLAFAPKGIVLESEADILATVDGSFWQAAASYAMPPGNVIWVDDEERQMLANWRAMLRGGAVQGRWAGEE